MMKWANTKKKDNKVINYQFKILSVFVSCFSDSLITHLRSCKNLNLHFITSSGSWNADNRFILVYLYLFMYSNVIYYWNVNAVRQKGYRYIMGNTIQYGISYPIVLNLKLTFIILARQEELWLIAQSCCINHLLLHDFKRRK